MHHVSPASRPVPWRFACFASLLGFLPVLSSLSGCGDSFVPCKEYRKCADPSAVAGAGGESNQEPSEPLSGANQGGAMGDDACTPGALSCQGQVVLQCQAGTWTQVGTCPLACLGEGECGGECVPDSRDCDDKTPRVCTAEGAWKPLEECPDACSGNGNCIGHCIPETQDCLEDVPRTCSPEGEWQDGAACPFVCTGAGECGGECKPGDGKCEGNVPYACHDAGVWIAQTACEKVCSGKGECTGACKPGDRDCSGNKPRVCNEEGAWDEEAACEFVCSGAGECTGECVPATKACDGYGYKTCSAEGAYVHGECPTATPVCSGNGVCGGSCVAWTESLGYDPVIVGECCTTSSGTGFLSKSYADASVMVCRGVGNDPAQGKLATASSSLAAYPPSNANDGDVATVWKANTLAANEWVIVDLGESVSLRGVVFSFDAPGAFGYKVETSTYANGLVWINRGTATSTGDVAAHEAVFVTSNVRLVRVTFTSVPPGRRAALSSIRVH